MASNPNTVDFIVDFIVEQVASAGAVTARKMFGDYGIFCDGRLVALVCDDRLFVKKTASGEAFVGSCAEDSPYPGAKPCFVIPGDKWDDREWLSQLVKLSAAELPLPKKKGSANPTQARARRTGGKSAR